MKYDKYIEEEEHTLTLSNVEVYEIVRAAVVERTIKSGTPCPPLSALLCITGMHNGAQFQWTTTPGYVEGGPPKGRKCK
jgi:hypothetical protein